jgi:hypothetical protein
MPQLVKGGKNAYAWSRVTKTGKILIPVDAFAEYDFKENEVVILLSGSKTSGGFALIRKCKMQKSPISAVLQAFPALMNQKTQKGKSLKISSKCFCWTLIEDGSITLPNDTLLNLGIKKDDLLLVVRGSNFGLGFVVKGPIIEEAKKHKELKVYE